MDGECPHLWLCQRLNDEGWLGGKLFKAAVGDCFPRGDKPKLRRSRRRFCGRTLRPVEKLAQRHGARIGGDDAAAPVLLERRDTVPIHNKAPVYDKPGRDRPDFWQKERIAHGE